MNKWRSILKNITRFSFTWPQKSCKKVECFFLVLVVSYFLHVEFGPNDHRDEAPCLLASLVNTMWLTRIYSMIMS